MSCDKNYPNQPMFHKVIQKTEVTYFYTHGVLYFLIIS